MSPPPATAGICGPGGDGSGTRVGFLPRPAGPIMRGLGLRARTAAGSRTPGNAPALRWSAAARAHEHLVGHAGEGRFPTSSEQRPRGAVPFVDAERALAHPHGLIPGESASV